MTPSLPSTPATGLSQSSSARGGRRACDAVFVVALATFAIGVIVGRAFHHPLPLPLPSIHTTPSTPAAPTPSPPSITFFTTVYDRDPNSTSDDNWRKIPSKNVLEHNDALLRSRGHGITVFTNDPSLASYNVSRTVHIPAMRGPCPADVLLCPKLHFFTTPHLWSTPATAAVHLDADAAILHPSFVDQMEAYLRLPVDFVASPGHERWKVGVPLPPEKPYNTGVYYMRLAAFDVPDFRTHLQDGVKLDILASANSTFKPHNKTHTKPKPFGEQNVFNNYIDAHPDLRAEYLPWRMHCRGRYVRDDCWLVHGWAAHEYLSGVRALPTEFGPVEMDWDMQNRSEIKSAAMGHA